jgi:hypothetical protein
MMSNTLPMNSGAALTTLKVWLLPNDDLTLHQSHLIITFGPPFSQEFRCRRMQEYNERMTSLEGWSFYSPDHCVGEGGDDCRVYGAKYSSSDMNVFDVVLNQLKAIKHEKTFKYEMISLSKASLHWICVTGAMGISRIVL